MKKIRKLPIIFFLIAMVGVIGYGATATNTNLQNTLQPYQDVLYEIYSKYGVEYKVDNVDVFLENVVENMTLEEFTKFITEEAKQAVNDNKKGSIRQMPYSIDNEYKSEGDVSGTDITENPENDYLLLNKNRKVIQPRITFLYKHYTAAVSKGEKRGQLWADFNVGDLGGGVYFFDTFYDAGHTANGADWYLKTGNYQRTPGTSSYKIKYAGYWYHGGSGLREAMDTTTTITYYP